MITSLILPPESVVIPGGGTTHCCTLASYGLSDIRNKFEEPLNQVVALENEKAALNVEIMELNVEIMELSNLIDK